MNSKGELPEKLKNSATIIYTEIKNFSGSPIFFILLGCSFLFSASKMMENTHPSFVFLLAILGVSIVLYGTGTQGVGSADFNDVPVKVAVAGGAGVLAAVFGFGIVWQSEKIQKVFKTEQQYGLIELKNPSKLFEPTALHITANALDGRGLHLLSKSDTIEILMPIASFTSKARVCVTITSAEGKSMTGPNPCPDITWETVEDRSHGEQITHFGAGVLPLVEPRSTRVDEQNRPVESLKFVPQ